jgi:hypothetical protein
MAKSAPVPAPSTGGAIKDKLRLGDKFTPRKGR